jgi:3-oxoacyl-[acyl-carrier protein] reductase
MARLSKLSRSIAGRVAIVTGAASGMGRATAHLFADEGARVAVVDRDAEGVDRVVEEIRRAGGVAAGFVVDLADPMAAGPLVLGIRKELGPVDILVNNAGVAAGGPIDSDGYQEQWDRAMAVNLAAPMHLIRACLPDLQRRGEGRIVNISSTEGLLGSRRTSPYTASKHGLIGLTKALAVDLGPTGVTVNAVCPGAVRTAMTDGIPDDAREAYARRRVPARRYADPEEIAHVTLSLVLPAASYVNGASVVVDGGLSVKGD